MKKRMLLCLLALGSLLLSANLISAEVIVTTSVRRDVNTSIMSFFGALRDGNVQTIRLYLSDKEYERHKVLFEQNDEFPAFLRKFYRGATARVGEIQSVKNANDDVVAEFIVQFSSGDTSTTRLRLTRDVTRRWIVKKYLADKYDQGESFGEGR